MTYNRDNNYGFLPTSAKEVKNLGWDYIDIIIFTGDAYVDHPSFGTAVIGRHLEAAGYRVAVVPQPSWQDDLRDFKKLGTPRLFFAVNGGNMDSMVNHYTAAKRLRSDDAYTPDSRAGMRPDYATVVYSNILKKLYPDTPVVIGGIEASLRRVTHYDYWADELKPSILIDSKADYLIYGMGDKVMADFARAAEDGFQPHIIQNMRQVAFIADRDFVEKKIRGNYIVMNSFEECQRRREALGENFVHVETESNRVEAQTLVEGYKDSFVVINPPYPMLTTQELDYTYSLPYRRRPHFRYKDKAISAFEMIKYSVNIHRGCFGGCSFCTISAHQGKFISSRSEESIISELKTIAQDPDFKGVISDLGGPSANMWQMGGKNRDICRKCSRPSCIFPSVCKNMDNSHKSIIELYEKCKKVDGIKKIFIGSGIRYDMLDEKYGTEYIKTVIKNHTSGRLKVAPEHTEERVLKMMRKPSFTLFEKLNTLFGKVCRDNGLKYELIPYFISSHPACQRNDMAQLRERMKGLHFDLRQVQDFTPTPLTLSTTIYYTGVDPYSGEKVFTEHDPEKKKAQKQFFLGMQKGERDSDSSNSKPFKREYRGGDKNKKSSEKRGKFSKNNQKRR